MRLSVAAILSIAHFAPGSGSLGSPAEIVGEQGRTEGGGRNQEAGAYRYMELPSRSRKADCARAEWASLFAPKKLKRPFAP
jgi:hypothetical protein